MAEEMRIATGQFSEPTPGVLQFAAQMGVSGIVLNTPRLPGAERWEVEDLVRLRQRVEAHGLRIESIENVPTHFYDLAMLGLEGAERQIANYQATIRHIGEAGIPIPRLQLDAKRRVGVRSPEQHAAAPGSRRLTWPRHQALRPRTDETSPPTRCGPTTRGSRTPCCRLLKPAAYGSRCTLMTRPSRRWAA